MFQKMPARFSSTTMQLEPIFIILVHLIFLAFKHMQNFPPHLSCVATLPENTLATEYARSFPLGRLAVKRSWMMPLTDN